MTNRTCAPASHRQQPPSKNASAKSNALSHTNRMGATFYLHGGKTKTGKPRYFVAKTIREGALFAMPDGFEFAESINAVVSVRRLIKGMPKIPDTHLVLARVHRMTYRGDGGWSHPLYFGPLQEMLRKYVEYVGTDEFFELH